MIDDFDSIGLINNRIKFSAELEAFINELPDSLKKFFAAPRFKIHLAEESDSEDLLLTQLNLPVIVKAQEGSLKEFSHTFFICSTKEALSRALAFEGFKGGSVIV
jgi:hypothetical protein